MAIFDLPLDELRTYKPVIDETSDFDEFWRASLASAAAHPIAASFEPHPTPEFRLVDVFDAGFAGHGGQRIKAWLIVPAGSTAPLPCIVSYVGYGGGRSLPLAHIAPCVAGFAHFVMDTRGQGSVWSPGGTPDDAPSQPHVPGFMTQGIASPQSYYYQRVMIDAARAVEAAACHDLVDPERIAVSGESQGGGLALAAAVLAADRVKLLVSDLPLLCHFRRAIEITDALPYAEIATYLRCHRDRAEQVFRTLSYFDGCSFATRVRARTLMSVALMDQVCPPSTVFAAYNRITAPKELRVYPYNEHEGGDVFHATCRLRFFHEHLA